MEYIYIILAILVFLVPRYMSENLTALVEGFGEQVHYLDRANPIKTDSNEPMNLSCSTDLNLSQPLLWYDTMDKLDISHYTSLDAFSKNISIHFVYDDKEDGSYRYIYCVDPITLNPLKGFQLQRPEYTNMYRTHSLTSCTIDDSFWTVLSCRDIYIPPTAAKSCLWRYEPFDGTSYKRNKTLLRDYLVLGYSLPAFPGNYSCECGKPTSGSGKEILLNFNVKHSTGKERDTQHYLFCYHFTKRNETSVQGPIDTLRREQASNTIRSNTLIVICVLLSILCIVLAGLFAKYYRKAKQSRANITTDPEELSPLGDQNTT